MLVFWLQQHLVRLAGEMRLEAAIPLLTQQLGSETEDPVDEAFTALEWIGTDSVVQALDARWRQAHDDLRCSIAYLLEHIHTDLSAEKCLHYLLVEEEPEVQAVFANAVLGQFCEGAIAPVWVMLNDTHEEELTAEVRDLRYRMVAVAQIMGRRFPVFEQWYRDALRDNWGWFERTPSRLADVFNRGSWKAL